MYGCLKPAVLPWYGQPPPVSDCILITSIIENALREPKLRMEALNTTGLRIMNAPSIRKSFAVLLYMALMPLVNVGRAPASAQST